MEASYKMLRAVCQRSLNRVKHKLYIHCGLHKTGTKTLQRFLRQNAEILRSAGILYPRAGCLDSVSSGHHNIAWQIARDRRFEKGFGDIEALTSEIGNFSGDVLLSSEDFECSLGRSNAFAPVVRYAISTQREIVFIIYLRNQISYLESLYCQMLKHGFGEEYQAIADQVTHRNICVMREWVFHFDYQRIAARVASIPNARLVFRSLHTLHRKSLVADFASVLCIESALTLVDETLYLRLNERATPAISLSLFYKNRVGRPLDSAEIEVVERLCHYDHWRLKTGKDLRESMVKAFRKGNKRFCRNHKVPQEGLALDDNDEKIGSVSIERFFSFETQCAVREIASIRKRLDLSCDAQSTAMAVNESALKAWWTCV